MYIASVIYDLVLNHFGDFGKTHMFWILYILNVIFGAIAYKLGFARKLPLIKSVFVYILLAIGMFLITIFSLMRMPMTESLIIISVVLAIYRFRLHNQRKKKQQA
ncbi:YlaH-like family protein [Virgibacillus sp. 179-BFC.A HS]|uniref:YlaH-like family protein n=1 Tax=Tigheibacillus jepli TaxID=3035914 RepID=A0ABU5CI29_9BACI|nr:YlaH-like family protein [Virgibacillus sp. 179-BFC.A HS]MDY0406007.1 YlaH-like family protein [Virgibacillus sp. 179-BFC.A HS]